ncbi:MAG TPA: hypothetical protein DCX17_00075 [Firmicutes bacterium]|nr:hypothetical protein [Bacillota bacterium]
MNKKLPGLLVILTGLMIVTSCQSSLTSSEPSEVNYSFSTPDVSIDPAWPTTPVNEVTRLDFYSLNDFHGALEYNAASGEIGINRLATYFNLKQEANPDGTIILAAGDFFQGSADSNITRGRLMVDAMNLIGFDAMTIGNHEFDWGVEVIESNAERANFPLLSANIFEKQTGQLADFAIPYTMIDRAGVRIGIIGTIGSTLESSILTSNVIDYDFIPIGPIVEASATYLRSMGAKAIVLLNHDADVTSDVASYVDVVFNAHSHDTYKRLVSGTPVLQAAYNGKAVAHVQFEYTYATDELSLVTYENDTSLINQELGEDEAMAALYQQYLDEEINVIKNEVLGTASDYFSKAKLGDLAVKEMLSFGSTLGAQVAFHNTGGVRNTISQGTVTYGDIYKVFPFDNELMIVEVTGVQLKWWLNQGNYVAGANDFTMTLDGGVAIKDSQVYKIIAINYLTEKFLSDESQYPHNPATAINTFEYVRELIKDKWQDVGTLDPADYIG